MSECCKWLPWVIALHAAAMVWLWYLLLSEWLHSRNSRSRSAYPD